MAEEYGLVVISALIESPAGGDFLATHACHVMTLAQLETEVATWKESYEKDKFAFKVMLITHVPRKLYEPQKT